MRFQVQPLALFSELRIQHCRWCALDLALLWLWCRLSAAALILPLARELPYAAGVAIRWEKKPLCLHVLYEVCNGVMSKNSHTYLV